MKKASKRSKGKATGNRKLGRQTKFTVLGAKSVLRNEEIYKQWITPISENKRWKVINGKTFEQIAETWERYGSKFTNMYVIGEGDYIKPLTEGYYLAKCYKVIELPDGMTVIMMFEPYDENRQRCSDISLTLQKVITGSEALGELIFGLGYSMEEVHSSDGLVIRDMDEFRKRVIGTKYGIEVSVNLETGWLYVTDIFNMVDSEDRIPSCPTDIIRNEF